MFICTRLIPASYTRVETGIRMASRIASLSMPGLKKIEPQRHRGTETEK
jgi:hypothetical protein